MRLPIRIRKSVLFPIALALFVPCGTIAQSGEDWLRLRLGLFVRPDATWAQVEAGMMQLFRASDPDGNGITPTSYDTLQKIGMAQARASLLQQRLVYDLDGDGNVTREELKVAFGPRARQPLNVNGIQIEPTSEQVAKVLGKLVSDALKDDADNDGIITFTEMIRAAQAQADKVRPANAANHVPMSLDRNGDGVITAEEFRELVRAAFAEIDRDRDGKISAAEAEGFQSKLNEAREAAARAEQERRLAEEQRKRMEACGFPKVPAGAKMVLFSAYEGKALSTVSLGGDDTEVTTANVVIEPGPDPLYVVLSSHNANIWQVRGAVDRIAVLVANAMTATPDKSPRVGVTGVAKEKIYIPPQAGCIGYFSEHPSSESLGPVSFASALIGRKPDFVSADYGVATVTLPSGQVNNAPYGNAIQLPSSGPSVSVWKEMLRFNPGGLVQLNPDEVVSRVPARRYQVLPQQAGLAQLVEEGALKVAGQSQGILLMERKPEFILTPNEFLIVRKIRFPAGLNGAHSVKFILARDVPAPEGDPGHSCLMSEENGRAIRGVCR